MNEPGVKQSVLDIIQQKYQIVETIDLQYYDVDPEAMADVLKKYFNTEFAINQRLVVLHHETDYYPNMNTIGNTIYNFLRLCANYLIPIDRIILLTNHYGIKKEVQQAAEQICATPDINVIYTSQWYDFPDLEDINHVAHTTQIDYLFCCVNGQQRQHRIMTLCMLQEYQLFDQGLISYHFGN